MDIYIAVGLDIQKTIFRQIHGQVTAAAANRAGIIDIQLAGFDVFSPAAAGADNIGRTQIYLPGGENKVDIQCAGSSISGHSLEEYVLRCTGG
jgi:hypothetical protein